jgi:hypothetical protein
MKNPQTSPSTNKSTNSPSKMAGWGNAGNTHGTRLPNNGAAKGSKKK